MHFRQHARTAQHSTLRLLGLFVLVLALLVLAVNAVLALILALMWPFANGWPTYFFETNTALVLLFVLGGCWVETVRLRDGGKHVAIMAGGREAQTSSAGSGGDLGLLERRFANVVREMNIASGHPALPAAWVLPKDDAINAFAAGWGSDDAVVAVTRGALERLTRAELQGVVAHEFSHLVHGDTRLNMRLIGLVWGLQMIWGLGLSLWERDSDGRRGFGALFGLGLIAVGSLGWVAGRLLQAAVSRQREFLADASAVKYTRVVDGLGGALRKIAEQQLQGRAGLQSPHAASLAHLLLAQRGAPDGWRALWHTHPPLAERLRRLYGRAVLPLRADVLEVDDQDDVPVMRMAPAQAAASAAGAAGAVASATALAATAHAAASPEAPRHDPLQVPVSFDARAREQEALARIARWHGPGEWQAGMLALALDHAVPGSPDHWAAWQAATADLGVAASVQREVEPLGAAARRQALNLLLQHARTASPSHRHAMHRALRQRWARLPPTPASRWHMLALSLLLAGRHARSSPGLPGASLPQLAGAAHAATAQLARALGVAAGAGQAWQQAAAKLLAEYGAAVPRGPAAGLAPATPLRELQLALRVRRLSPMQRPLLLRAWMLAAQHAGLAQQAGVADALHLACLTLDLPVPEALNN